MLCLRCKQRNNPADYMASIGDIVAVLRMDNSNFTRGTKKSRKDAGTLGGALRKVGSAAKKAAVAFVAYKAAQLATRGATASIDASATLDTALQKSIAIQNLSIAQQHAMREAAIEVAADVSASSAEVAEGFFFLASAGLDAEQQIAALPQVAAFAQAGMFDLATATDLATDAQAAMGLTSKDAAENLEGLQLVTDTLVGANTIANASVEQFSKALTSGAGAAAKDVGISIQETVAVLAAFADQGIKAENAGTQFSIVLRDLQSKAIKNKEAFQAAGIAVFDQSGEFRRMSDIIGNLETKMAGLSDETRKSTLLQLGFSDKSVGALQKLLGTSEKIAAYEERLKSMGGITEDVAGKSLTAFDKSLNKLNKTWERLKITLGAPMIERLIPIIDKAAVRVEKFAQTAGTLLRQLGVIDGAGGAKRVDYGPVTSDWNDKMQKKRVAHAQILNKFLESNRKAEQKVGEAAEKNAKAQEKAAGSLNTTWRDGVKWAGQLVRKATEHGAALSVATEQARNLNLVSSAAEGAEAFTRIFETIAQIRNKPDSAGTGSIAEVKALPSSAAAAVGGGATGAIAAGSIALLQALVLETQKNTIAVKKISEDVESI